MGAEASAPVAAASQLVVRAAGAAAARSVPAGIAGIAGAATAAGAAVAHLAAARVRGAPPQAGDAGDAGDPPPRERERDVVEDVFESVANDPVWRAALLHFVDSNCEAFTSDEDNAHALAQIHGEYCALYETLLTAALRRLRVGLEELVHALQAGRAAGRLEAAMLYDMLDAMASYSAFKELMVARHYWLREARRQQQGERARAAGMGAAGGQLRAEAAEVARVHLWGMAGAVAPVPLFAAQLKDEAQAAGGSEALGGDGGAARAEGQPRALPPLPQPREEPQKPQAAEPAALDSPPRHLPPSTHGWLAQLPVPHTGGGAELAREPEHEREEPAGVRPHLRRPPQPQSEPRPVVRLRDGDFPEPRPRVRRASHDWLASAAAAARRLERSRVDAAHMPGEREPTGGVGAERRREAEQEGGAAAVPPAVGDGGGGDDSPAARAAALEARLARLLSLRAAREQEERGGAGAGERGADDEELDALLGETEGVRTRRGPSLADG